MKAVLTLIFISLFGTISGQDSLLRLKHKWVQDYMNETVFCYQEHSIDNYNSFAVTPDSVCSLLLQDSLDSKYIYVSDKIEHFNNVIELEIEGNGIVRISSRIGSLTKLRCLEIEGQIDDLSIPDSLRLCDNLEIIDFSGEKNTITKLPEGVLALKKLKFLTVDMSGVIDEKIIDDIFEIAKSTNIVAVILYNCDSKRSDKTRLIETGKVAFFN